MERVGFKGVAKRLFKRYFIDAMSGMAMGLFASLIIGLIISQISKIPGLSFLEQLTGVLAASSPVVGSAIGVAIAYGLKSKPLTVFSSAATGAIGYSLGGPVGAYIAAVVGVEIGALVAGKTKMDIVVTPLTVIVAGGLAGIFVGPGISQFMTWIGAFINAATELHKIPMGIIVSVVMGMALTAPISSAAIAISLNLTGLAAGAATAGCCANMIGFAVISFKENGWGGLLSQGLGTSMLQVPNIVKKPVIWVPVILASAILGPISTTVAGMTNVAMGAGMGTSGLVGTIGTWTAMAGTQPAVLIWIKILVMQFIAPAALSLAFAGAMRKVGWIKTGDMKLKEI